MCSHKDKGMKGMRLREEHRYLSIIQIPPLKILHEAIKSLGNGLVPPPPARVVAAAPDGTVSMFGAPAQEAPPAGPPTQAPAAADPVPQLFGITGGGNPPRVPTPALVVPKNNAAPAPPHAPAIGASIASHRLFVVPAANAAALNLAGFLKSLS
ncbi:hypothetical protein HOY80DRAFT_1042358 [Tuber brumale]|nr:hypothetical protein HOY80DRAFT_1042358 [Tuber brumale]